jgi:hypothetical protein
VTKLTGRARWGAFVHGPTGGWRLDRAVSLVRLSEAGTRALSGDFSHR